MFDTSVFANIRSKADYDAQRQAMMQKRKQMEMQDTMNKLKIQQAQKDLGAPDEIQLKKLAETALLKRNMGQPLSAQEEAAIQSMAQIAPPSISTDSLGRTISQPSGWSKLSPAQVMSMPPSAMMGQRGDSGMVSPTMQEVPMNPDAGFTPVDTSQPDLPMDGLPQDMVDPTQISGGQDLINQSGVANTPLGQAETLKTGLDIIKAEKMDDFKRGKELEKAEKGRNQIDVVLADMKSDYEALKELDAIRNTNAPLSTNLKNYLATTGIGSQVGQAAGSEAEAIRERIRTSKPKMMGAMKDALGLTGTELNSQQELQFYLNALTDPSQDFNTNMMNIQRLSRDWGGGKFDPNQMNTFSSVKDAEAANLPRGTEIMINGRRAIVE